MLVNRFEEKLVKQERLLHKIERIMKTLTNKDKRKLRIRNKVSGTADRPRLSIHRSNKHIIAQLIDDKAEKTLVGISTASMKDAKGTKSEVSFELGKKLGELAIAKKVKTISFDRGASKYHGRVKQVAEGAREAGLEF